MELLVQGQRSSFADIAIVGFFKSEVFGQLTGLRIRHSLLDTITEFACTIKLILIEPLRDICRFVKLAAGFHHKDGFELRRLGHSSLGL